jgi:hypothetical protein
MRPAAAPSVASALPAPVGGWNARDSLADMDVTDAVVLENWFPSTTSLVLRNGYTSYATGATGQNETLIVYAGVSSNKMKTITASGNLFDVSAAGAVGAAELTGLLNARFQYVNLTTTGGSYACMVNGADVYRVYDGTNWHKDGDGAPYDITGVTSSTLIHINVFKSRLWFVQKNTLKAWYLPINSIGGAATSLDLSSIFQMGGSLMAMGTWTIDAGYGVDDYAVWITTKGEVAVYRLTDPTTPTGIALVGIFRVGSPVGRRCFVKYAGDLLLISQDGVLPLSAALQSSRLNPRVSLTDKITFAMSNAVTSYGSNFGWQIVPFPKANQLYVNVPVSEGSSQQQYVMNTITKNWCNFTGWAANCWDVYNDDLYFGGNGFVGKAWSGLIDGTASINGRALQAFSDFKSPSINKRFTLMRPVLFTNGTPQVYGNINTDYDTSDTTAALSFSPTTYATWDLSLWDTGIWGQDLSVQKNWQGTTGFGKTGAPQFKVAASGIQVQWVSTDVVYERGAIL